MKSVGKILKVDLKIGNKQVFPIVVNMLRNRLFNLGMKYSAITQTATYTIPNNLNVHYTITVDKDFSDDTTGKLKTEFLVNLRTILSEFK